MRVILEPTSTMVDLQYRVEIESPSDELTIWERYDKDVYRWIFLG